MQGTQPVDVLLSLPSALPAYPHNHQPTGDAAEELLACAGDLLPVLAGAAGAAAYAPVLASQHLPALLTRLRPSQPDGIRGVAVGAIAELSERMQVRERTGQGAGRCVALPLHSSPLICFGLHHVCHSAAPHVTKVIPL